MSYQIKVLLLSFFVGLVISLIVIPILRKLKVGQIEREDGPQSHLKKQGTPTMGGIIMIATIIIMLVASFIQYRVTELDVVKNLIPLVLVSLGFGLIGLIDDFKN